MSLRKVEGLPGPPWDRPLAGMLDRITVHSEVLEGNPLGAKIDQAALHVVGIKLRQSARG